MRVLRRNRYVLGGLEVGTTLVLLAVIWFATKNSTSPYVPALSTILTTFKDTWLFSRFGSDIVPSLLRLFAGFGFSIILGVAIGVALGASWVLRALFDPIVTFLRSIPPPIIIPIVMVVLGLGNSTKITVIAFVCTWPIAVNTEDGVLSLDPTALATARSYQISGITRLRSIVLPAVAPRAFAGMRMSLTLAILMLVVAEMLGSTSGIGYFVMSSQQQYEIPEMWAGIILLGIIGFVLNGLFQLLENRILAWRQ
jgi:ABC-type nitrate/sulfonate/bicarbonate transport system permease component